MARVWHHIDPANGNWSTWEPGTPPSAESCYRHEFLNQFVGWWNYLYDMYVIHYGERLDILTSASVIQSDRFWNALNFEYNGYALYGDFSEVGEIEITRVDAHPGYSDTNNDDVEVGDTIHPRRDALYPLRNRLKKIRTRIDFVSASNFFNLDSFEGEWLYKKWTRDNITKAIKSYESSIIEETLSNSECYSKLFQTGNNWQLIDEYHECMSHKTVTIKPPFMRSGSNDRRVPCKIAYWITLYRQWVTKYPGSIPTATPAEGFGYIEEIQEDSLENFTPSVMPYAQYNSPGFSTPNTGGTHYWWSRPQPLYIFFDELPEVYKPEGGFPWET